MTAEIKPCPFCGGVANVSPTASQYIIECNNADCSANPDAMAPFKHEAIAAWNRRATPADLDAEGPPPLPDEAVLRKQFDTQDLRDAMAVYVANIGQPGEPSAYFEVLEVVAEQAIGAIAAYCRAREDACGS